MPNRRYTLQAVHTHDQAFPDEIQTYTGADARNLLVALARMITQ